MHSVVNGLNSIIWSQALILLCLGAGLFYSIVTRFAQVRHFREMIRLLFSGRSSSQGISAFQALSVSLSGRVGTGNIAGVAAAISFGGPGAVFWMWTVAFLGAATAYVESTLGQIYKEEDQGQYRGGPAYYLEKALGQKWYGWAFAISTIVATGLLLPGVQANSISNAVELAVGGGQVVQTGLGDFTVTKIVTGLLIVTLLGIIIFGGIRRIAHFAQVVVPFMALGYILMACAISVMNFSMLPDIMALILKDAFTPMAGVGAAIGWGVKRGVYSNEAGQGTGPHAAAAAEVQHPAQQGLVQAFSIYVDTLLVCTATAFMILITGAYNVHGGDAGFLVQNLPSTVDPNSPAFTQLAVDSVFSGFGKPFVAVALFFFAFTTLIAYYYIAETNVAYIHRNLRVRGMIVVLKIALLGSTLYGALKTASFAWALGDIGVGLMAWLNIIGILIIFFVSKPAVKSLRDYEAQKKAGVTEYTFDPEALGIANADFWVRRKREHDIYRSRR